MAKQKKINVLWASDSPEILQVGQSRVTRELCYRFHDNKRIDISVAGYMPDTDLFRTNPITEFKIHNWKRFETQKFVEIIQNVKPEILVLSHDPFMFNCVHHLKATLGKDPMILGYFTIDGEPLPRIFKEIFYDCDKIVSPSQYGRRVINDRFFDIDVDVIPYAVNQQLYGCKNKEEVRREMSHCLIFGNEKINIKDKVVYCYVGNNQGRKNVAVARDAFKRFASRHSKDVIFVLIMKNVMVTQGDIQFLGYFDIFEFQHPNIRVVSHPVSDEVVSKLYQMSDYLLHPTIGEGFSFTLAESLSCRCTPVTTNFASSTDFCNDKNSLMINDFVLMRGEFDVYRAMADEDKLVDLLEYSYDLAKNKSEKLEKLRDNGQKTMSKYSWDDSANKFIDVFDKMIARKDGDRRKARMVRF